MTDEQVLHFLRSVRFSDKRLRYGRKALSINAIALKAATSRDTIYATLNGEFQPNRGIRRAAKQLSGML